MKRILFILTILAVVVGADAQNRRVARGAEQGELYMTEFWYGIYDPVWGPPFYDTLRTAVYHITEHGKKLTIQYDDDYFAELYTHPDSVILDGFILADATPGVVYIKHPYSKDDYAHTSLWVSFDYGKNWTFREEDIGSKGYFSANIEGLIYRTGTDGYFNSEDYGEKFCLMEIGTPGGEPGLQKTETFGLKSNISGQYKLLHTSDLITYTEIPIDAQFIFGNVNGFFPDIYRGGLPGEVYIASWFPDVTYKVSFSADTGHTFRHVFDEYINLGYNDYVTFMSDREPGVFYIIRIWKIEDFNPWGWHLKICVDYYRDYGETLVDTYCHDITKDYGDDVGIAEPEGKDGVVVYPNPTGGELRVTSYGLQVTGIEIFDLMGKNVLSQKAESGKQKELDISHLPSGMYFVRIQTEKGIINKKIVKY